jgi:hypothetical protein
MDVKNPTIKNHFIHIWYNVVLHAFCFPFHLCNMSQNLGSSLHQIFWKYECAYGLKDHHGDIAHGRSSKWGCLASFLVKWLYTQPEVCELMFYHRTHDWMNGESTHGQCDPNSMAWLSLYVPWMSQTLRQHICMQLNLNTLPNKYMTSTRQFGGHKSMQENP